MRIATKQRADEEVELVLLVATADGAFRSLHARSGDMLAPQWTLPKAKEPLVACMVLSLDGSPAQVRTGVMVLYMTFTTEMLEQGKNLRSLNASTIIRMAQRG